MKTFIRSVLGIIGLTAVIIIHEAGHFFAALFFGVPVTTFSVGFGPALWTFPTRWTTFQVAILPLGGYVELLSSALDTQSYWVKAIILLAGIASNLLSAYLMLIIIGCVTNGFSGILLAGGEMKAIAKGLRDVPGKFFAKEKPVIIGPFKIISLIGQSVEMGWRQLLYVLAFLSINVALFNLLPLPFLDGGQLWGYTVAELIGYLGEQITYLLLILLILLFILRVISKTAEKK